MNYPDDQLRAYSTLFSRRGALSWLHSDFSNLDRTIQRYDGKWMSYKGASYRDYLKYVYSLLADNYQNEYIFKNEFLNQWLIKELGKGNTKLFSEFRLGRSIADLTMFNGRSTVFEIKTEFDSPARWQSQLENYKRVFNEIYLIVPETKLKVYEPCEETVGLITFSPGDNKTFSLVRKSSANFQIDPLALMSILHSHEYKSIVQRYLGHLPDMTSFSQFHTCGKIIQGIPKAELNKLFLEEIKTRKMDNGLSSRYYREFNQLFLALRLKRSLKLKMVDSLKSPIQIL